MKNTCLFLSHLLLACVLCAGSCNHPHEAHDPPRTVRTMIVHPVYESSTQQTFGGYTRAAVETRLSFRVAGKIHEMHIEEGQRVRANDVLATLETEDYALRVEQAKAALEQALAAQEEANLANRRMRELYEEDAVAKHEYDKARTAAEAARAQVEAAHKRLALAERQLAYTTLEAPVDGYVSYVGTEEGENVAAGQVVAALSAEDQLEVALDVPAAAITSIETGQSVDVALPELSGAAALKGKVTEAGQSPSPRRTTFPVVVRLVEPPADALPGMAADVTFIERRQYDTPRFYVPISAVGEHHQGTNFVFVIREAGNAGNGQKATVELREVEIAERTDQRIAIVNGLKEGERVVTRGIGQLDDGEQVLLPPPGAEAPAP
ncbi:MAG: efflux RND transporter periplasmic adaptor subunit [Candidatus Hydrogenedentota bacterium]